jgi:hypothetical protein
MEYTDYEYYQDTYKGSLNENSFNSYILKASKEINKNINIVLTQDIIDILSESDQDKLQYATCEMVDLLNEYNTILNTARDVKSLSIDGVSKSYEDMSDIRNEYGIKIRAVADDLPQELTRYL